MKKTNGFTLIELLAVIVILAIIALIATPVIITVLNDARESAAVDSAYGVLKAGEYYFAQQLLADPANGMAADQPVDFPDDSNMLDIKGTKPTDGQVTISTTGTVTITENLVINGYSCSGSSSSVTCTK